MTSRSAAAVWAITGILLTVLGAVFSTGIVFGVLVSSLLTLPCLWLCARLDRQARIGLVALFLLGLTVRWVVTVFVDRVVYSSQPLLFAPDEGTYDLLGWRYSLFLEGRGPDPFFGEPPLAIFRVVAWIYYVFGRQILIPKMINCLLGAWSCVLTALLASTAFSPAVARRAGWYNVFTPSLVLWSSLLLKDSSTLLGSQMALLAFLWLRERATLARLLMMVTGLLLVVGNRAYEVMFLAAPVASGLFLERTRRPLRNFALVVVLSALLLFIVRESGAAQMAFGESTSLAERITMLRTGYASGAGSAIDVASFDVSTPAGMLAWIPIGLVYFFFAPFPFASLAIRSLATTPEMLVVYYFTPTIWRSFRAQLKRRDRNMIPMLMFLLVSAVGWSLVITNVGTIYRYRAQVFFVVLILVAAAQVQRKEAAAKRE